jgi:hypothetical protein
VVLVYCSQGGRWICKLPVSNGSIFSRDVLIQILSPIFCDTESALRNKDMERDHTALVWCHKLDNNQSIKCPGQDSKVAERHKVMSNVKVNPTAENGTFSDNSFVDFLKIYHVEHSTIVKDFGHVDGTYIDRFFQSWLLVFIGSLSFGSRSLADNGARQCLNKGLSEKLHVCEAARRETGSYNDHDNKGADKCQDDWDLVSADTS